MKKSFLLLCAMLIAMSTMAERITEQDAALVAGNFLTAQVQKSNLKKSAAVRPAIRKVALEETNQFYVYQNANGEGWVMVAANDAAHPILAYSDKGQFHTEGMPENMRWWLGKYSKTLAAAEADNAVATEEVKKEWNALRKGTQQTAATVVASLVKSKWDQDDPYWLYTPGSTSSGDKAYTGCVATAMAQVMNYWEWPKTGTGSHSYKPTMDIFDNYGNYQQTITIYDVTLSANFGETNYDWDNMLDTYTNSATTAQKQAVATLMLHCGVGVEMQYGGDDYDGSGALDINYNDESQPSAENALWQYFGYNKSTIKSYLRDGYTQYGYNKVSDADWIAMLKKELDEGRPMMYGGSGSYGGHSFICDGYDSNDKFSFNWGWSGQNDGFYALNNLVPGSGGAGGGSYSFSEDQSVIIGIQPDQQAYTVTFNAGSNGTCATTSLTESEVGAGVVLPAVTANSGYTFLGWATQSGATIADAGQAGETYKPSRNITLYAVYKHDGYVVLAYDLTGVEKKSGAAAGEIAEGTALTATFAAADGYLALTEDNCLVEVLVGGTEITNCTSIAAGVLTVTLTAAQVTGNVEITIVATKDVQGQLEPNYAEADYYADYSSTGAYNWTVYLAYFTTNSDYDWLMYIDVTTATKTAIGGTHTSSTDIDLEYCGLDFVNGTDTTELSATSVNMTLTYTGNDSDGYPMYDIAVTMVCDDGNTYTIETNLTIYAIDYNNNSDIDMTGDTGGGGEGGELDPNYAEADYYSEYSTDGAYNWTVYIADFTTNQDYNWLMYIDVTTPTLTAIAGTHTSSTDIEVEYCGLDFVNGTDTTELSATAVNMTLTYTGNDSEGYPMYDVVVSMTCDDGNTYTINTNLTIYVVDYETGEDIDMTGDTGGSGGGGETIEGVYYQKVTSAPSDWSGTYLIVCEDANVAFDGSLSTLDAVENNINVTISGNKIAATSATVAAEFTIAKSGTGYSIKSASGSYIGRNSNSNGLNAGSTAMENAISLNSGNAIIASTAGPTLQFNNADNQQRFRYYKSDNQKPVQLYIKVEEEKPVQKTYAITLVAEHGSINVVESGIDLTAVPENTVLHFTATPDAGYQFKEWKGYNETTGLIVTANATVEAVFVESPSGLDDVNGNALAPVKVLYEGVVYILMPDGRMYNVMGTQVR